MNALSKPRYVEGDPRSLTLLDLNARFMTHDQFSTLVRNVREDGHLTSTPLVWLVPEGTPDIDPAMHGKRVVLSGNHRTKASIEAGLGEIGWLEVDDPLPEQRAIALQLSHNSITGQDDPATLRRLYDKLEDIDWRQYSGLDDKTLDMLAKVDVGSLSEANLDFATVQVMFLPAEKEAAERSFEDARRMVSADARWLAGIDQYEATLAALQTVHQAYNVGNVATALGVVLAVFEHHLDELREGWYDEQAQMPRHNKLAPLESIFGVRAMPTDAAAIVAQAVDRMVEHGDVDQHSRWRALELMAADYLGGA